MEVKEILIAARALIADPEHWTQNSSAIENTGAEVDPISNDAYAFCADGALCKVCYDSEGIDSWYYQKSSESLNQVSQELYGASLVEVNDGEAGPGADVSDGIAGFETACHQSILRIYDEAISRS